MMRATFVKSGMNYLPALETDGKVEVLHGPPLAGIKTALKYARIEKQQRERRKP